MTLLEPYQTSIICIGLLGLLMLIQLLVADVVAIKKKHTPGFPIEADHNNLLFRANRTHVNCMESVPIFILFLSFSMLSFASPYIVNLCAMVFISSRYAYALAYYLNYKLTRSVIFIFSIISLISLFMSGAMTYI